MDSMLVAKNINRFEEEIMFMEIFLSCKFNIGRGTFVYNSRLPFVVEYYLLGYLTNLKSVDDKKNRV